MSEKPIIFNTEMVKGILEGRKVCTRRPVKLPKHKIYKYKGVVTNSIINKNIGNCFFESMIDDDNLYLKPPYETGDILYVRERFLIGEIESGYDYPHDNEYTIINDDNGTPIYYADHIDSKDRNNIKKNKDWDDCQWSPSIHMPKTHARLWLKVTGVRVERVQEITEGGALDEGITKRGHVLALDDFRLLWDSIYNNWDSNPWVWVIDFEVTKG